MKRIFFVCLIAVVAGGGFFVNGQEGFRGPGPDVVTVDAAKGLRDDYPVVLRGKIERSLGDEKYLFSDETGNIVIEIDHRIWRGLSVNQDDVVEITGEVDRGRMRTEIEARSIKKVTP